MRRRKGSGRREFWTGVWSNLQVIQLCVSGAPDMSADSVTPMFLRPPVSVMRVGPDVVDHVSIGMLNEACACRCRRQQPAAMWQWLVSPCGVVVM
jgi:hypothetical protein